MLIVEHLTPLHTGNLCTVDERGSDKKSKCGLLKLNGREITCHQEDCKLHHPAVCVENIKHTR